MRRWYTYAMTKGETDNLSQIRYEQITNRGYFTLKDLQDFVWELIQQEQLSHKDARR